MAEDTQLHMEKWQRLLIIVSTLLVLTVFLGVIVRLAEYIHHTLLLFALGALLAYAFEPLIEGLRTLIGNILRRGRKEPVVIPRAAAVTIVYVALLAVIGLGIDGLSHPLRAETRSLTDQRQQMRYHERARNYLLRLDGDFANAGMRTNFTGYIDNPASIPAGIQLEWMDMEHKALTFIGDVAVSVGESVVVLLISLYLTIYAHEMRDKFNAQLPDKLIPHACVWQEDVNRILGGFVRGQLILALVLGAAAAIGCLAIGIHIWLLIGIFVAFASLIPVFGPYLGAAPAIIASLLTQTHFSNPLAAVIVVVILFVVINEVGSKVIYPRLVGQAIGLHVVLVLFAIFAGLEIDGIVGVLFAAPLTAIGGVTLVHLYRLWQDLPDSLLSVRHPPTATRVDSDAQPVGPGLIEDGTPAQKRTVAAPAKLKAPSA